MFNSLLVVVAAAAAAVYAQQPAWAQCGGIGWSGGTTCVSGYYCSNINAYYFQCVPGVASSSASTASTSSAPQTTTSKTTATTTASSTTSASAPASSATSGVQIRAVQDPIFHLYLQNQNDTAVLGPEASSGYFTIGGTIALNGGAAPLYLNIGSETTSYRSLTFGSTASFSGWGLEGDTIITTQSSKYGRQLNFVACKVGSVFQTYLQLGSDVPAGSCTNYVSLHLPCLC
ncbi:hypothetical protein EXIGLDRAFT_123379 [Exidia glandulosa HHB12029]|uniref:CBM1 domain-containing protein n=1 Tax=Exidia glandulosa HHB12029 TaxID=1314781 RepID=A0A166BGD7_EXIGL|nr:hypothetical protein EXIGLDRAFT_123379 [Exidia glandulosa HHB12029]